MKHEKSNELLRIREVCRRTGMSRTTVYDRISKGAFPKPLHLSSRLVVWPSYDVDEWINRTITQLRGKQ